jgi:hypothetical protein
MYTLIVAAVRSGLFHPNPGNTCDILEATEAFLQ